MKFSRAGGRFSGLTLATIFVILPFIPFLMKITYHASALSTDDAEARGRTITALTAGENGADAGSIDDLRFELMASLDLLIRAQRVIQQETGSFTAAVGRVPDVLGPVASFYRVEIMKATQHYFLVTATGTLSGEFKTSRGDEVEGVARDMVSIDERFRVHANFPLPVPPAGYLRALAQSVLNRMQANPRGWAVPERAELDAWEGVYRGHFKYESRVSSQGARVAVAIANSDLARSLLGKGDLLGDVSVNIFNWIATHRRTAFGEYAARARLREIYLAQKILQKETGAFATSLQGVLPVWNALAVLDAPDSAVRMEEFQSDPALGYQAEIALLGSGDQIRNLWSVNGYGQVVQINPVEELMGRFERARRDLEPTRRVSSEGTVEPLQFDKISDSGR